MKFLCEFLLIFFIVKTYAGRHTPKNCCGSLLSNIFNPNTNQHLQRQPNRESNEYEVREDPVLFEDSYLSLRGECGIDTNGDRTVGSNVTDLDEYPWMALLGYRTPEERLRYECEGFLINHRYVMTAAHCMVGLVEEMVGKLVTVRLGEYNTETDVDCIKDDCADPPQEIPVKATYPHPGYSENNRNRANDIGLVRLARRALYTLFVQPICLVGPSSPKLNEGNSLVIAGWGNTPFRKSPVKRRVEMPVYNKKACDKKYRTLQMELTYSQICAGGRKDEDACVGDSGGPLMRQLQDRTWESIGVVSFGNGCGKPGWPGVYTAISDYLDWIQNTMELSNRY